MDEGHILSLFKWNDLSFLGKLKRILTSSFAQPQFITLSLGASYVWCEMLSMIFLYYIFVRGYVCDLPSSLATSSGKYLNILHDAQCAPLICEFTVWGIVSCNFCFWFNYASRTSVLKKGADFLHSHNSCVSHNCSDGKCWNAISFVWFYLSSPNFLAGFRYFL